MKWNCELIQDLLPLYEEDLCSPSSRRAVEEHLDECESCRALTSPLPIEIPAEPESADRAVKKSIKKVRRRWLTSLVAAVLLVPMLLLCFNQYRGQGLCFTNPDDVYTAWRFLHALEAQDWETAAKMHDFSGDYESIQDALEQDVAFWGPTFDPFDLFGYDYAAKTYLSRSEAIPETIQDLYGFLYNRAGTAMVPMELWAQLMAVDPNAFYQEGWQYWLNGELYGKITTPWGDFVVSEGRGYDTAYDYALYFDLIPAAVHAEAKPAIDAEARQLYAITHAHLDWVEPLSEAEFTQEMIRRYTADLEALADTVTFDCTGFRGAYLLTGNSGWHIQFGVTLTCRGQSVDATMSICVEDGKVCIVSIGCTEQVDWLDALDRALYPSAHPEY